MRASALRTLFASTRVALVSALCYTTVASGFAFLKNSERIDATVLQSWMLFSIIMLPWIAFYAKDHFSSRAKRTAHVAIGFWLVAAYAVLAFQNELLSTLVWIAAPLVCMAVVLIVPSHIEAQKIEAPKTVVQRRTLWRILALIIAILVVAFTIRMIKLGALGYSTDEGSTALYAWAINNTGLPCHHDICYLRGLPYLYAVAGVTHVFENNEFWVRFTGVGIEMLALVMSLVLIQHLWKRWKLTLLAAAIISFGGWQIMLGRYARMYGTMLLFLLIALWAYSKTFIQKKYSYLPILCIAAIAAMLTHQFGMLLVFFVIEPLLTKRWNLYKNPWFIGFCAFMLAATFVTLTKVPGITYISDAYKSLYELRPDLQARDAYWYLANLQLPNVVYIKHLFLYYPVSLLLFVFSTAYLFARQHTHRWIALFACWILFVTTIYRIDYALKYLWWILVIVHLVAIFGLCMYYRRHRFLAIIPVALLAAQLIFGMYVILTRDYGTNTTRLPILMPTHVEAYSPDDKTPAEYVAANATPDDIVITDYWMQNVYLQMAGHRMSDAHISQWNDAEFFKKFPYYQLYDDNGVWRLEKDGPKHISTIKSFVRFLQDNENRTIWYISSVDFTNKKYLYISTPSLNTFIRNNFGNDIVYTGKDNNSVVYKLSL